jgi:molybdenum cofactor cytidylyltransferase
VDEEAAVVIATRSYALDLEALQGALSSPARYVAVLGPAQRSQRMLKELEALGVKARPGVFFAPAGLDIGAQTPRELAVAIMAELLAVRSGHHGGRPKVLAKSSAPPPAQTRVPGLILAAGRGRRFAQGHKLSAMIAGRPVLRHAVENALASRLDPVIVVLGCEAESALKALRGIDDPRLRVVFNPRWEGGKSSSIECGLREVPTGAPGVVSLLGDMPRVPAWLIDRVVSEFELSRRLVFPVYPGPEGPTKGYPTAFPRSLFGEIRALTGDDTAMDAVREHWGQAVRIPLDDAYTQVDVDTPEDLELLLGDA